MSEEESAAWETVRQWVLARGERHREIRKVLWDGETWAPGYETHDGVQAFSDRYFLTIAELASWCRAQ